MESVDVDEDRTGLIEGRLLPQFWLIVTPFGTRWQGAYVHASVARLMTAWAQLSGTPDDSRLPQALAQTGRDLHQLERMTLSTTKN